MVEYVGDILGIRVDWLIEKGIISKPNYDYLVRQGKIKRLVRGGNGRKALIEWESLPDRIKERIIKELGKDPYEFYKYQYFLKYYKELPEALVFFTNYKLADGRVLSEVFDKRHGQYYSKIYYQNAKMLEAVGSFYIDLRGRWRAMGGRHTNIWENLSELVNHFREHKEMWHTLPAKARPLQRKWSQYQRDGYEALISKKFLNKNAQKVNDRIERVMLSLLVQKNKPYVSWVHRWYLDFLEGKIDVVDAETGEVLDREGLHPISLAEVYRIKEKLDNKVAVLIERNKSDRKEVSRYRPHVMRRSPDYSLSLITIDDFDLMSIRLVDGKHPSTYLAFDVKSGAIVGWAVSADKSQDLVFEMFRNMYHNLILWGIEGLPMELEVENFQMRKIEAELKSVFPMVRFTEPANAQEKRAERYIRDFKYKIIKRYSQFSVGRYYAKSEANRVPDIEYWNERGYEVKEPRYQIGEVRAMVREWVKKWNESEHPEFGKSRLDVLIEFQRPDLVQMPKHVMAKFFGYKAMTRRLRRFQYVKVLGNEYWLASPELLEKLESENVEVYYLPTQEELTEVYIWQGDKYIGRGVKKAEFNVAKSEQTEADKEAMQEQMKWIRKFDKQQKERRKELQKLTIIENSEIEEHEYEVIEREAEVVEVNVEFDDRDLERSAIESL